jgi:cellulose synthase operon protein YhjQ
LIPKYHNEISRYGRELELRRMTETPEDIATLYSRARIGWTRYWDFSASRKQVRQQLGITRSPLEWPSAPLPVAEFPGEPPEKHNEVQPNQGRPNQVQPNKDQPPQVQLQEVNIEDPGLQPQAAAQIETPGSEPESGPQTESIPQTAAVAAARWYALRSIFAPAQAPMDQWALPPFEQRPPIMVVFSLAGGVGKTCVVATLGRVLSALGEHVLLTETAVCGILPFYFGSRELRPGVMRTFFPPGAFGEDCDEPVQMLNLQADGSPGESSQHDPLTHDPSSSDPLIGELLRNGRGVSRIVVDVATANRKWMSRLLSLRPTFLVPILPDMSSVACLGSLEALDAGSANREKALYLLNQFDASSPLHRDVRAILQQQLGDRLLPFVLRRSAVVSEALAEGMTVVDYAPGSEVAADYHDLAGWLRSLSVPSTAGSGGRWSER